MTGDALSLSLIVLRLKTIPHALRRAIFGVEKIQTLTHAHTHASYTAKTEALYAHIVLRLIPHHTRIRRAVFHLKNPNQNAYEAHTHAHMCVYTVPNPYEKPLNRRKSEHMCGNRRKTPAKTPKNEALVSVWVGSHATCEYFDYAKNQTCYNAYVLELSTFAPVPHTHPWT